MSTHPDLVFRAIETFKYHPSILKIKEFMTNNGMSFSFGYTTQEKTNKGLQNLDKKRKWHPYENNKITQGYIFVITSITQFTVQFSRQNWKRLTLYPFIKRKANLLSKIIVLLVSFPFSPKCMKGVCLIKCIVTLIKFSLNISVDSNKVTALSIAFFLW